MSKRARDDGDGNGLRDHFIDPRYRLSIAEPVM
jgi:hypothetical protein